MKELFNIVQQRSNIFSAEVLNKKKDQNEVFQYISECRKCSYSYNIKMEVDYLKYQKKVFSRWKDEYS
jgi:hypothetical protein